MAKSKVTSAKLAKLASKVMRGYEPTRDEVESLAASVMAQREREVAAKIEAPVVAPVAAEEPAPAPEPVVEPAVDPVIEPIVEPVHPEPSDEVPVVTFPEEATPAPKAGNWFTRLFK